ncbi:uncharacterized protein BO96DRAFT_332173 [Aspergillus niger CBS 101883]|uniref:Uncharacterized protein n=2 Tax=Aspergillus niger TaxID=5061 RepID=A2QQN5_ASPNC|nr:uncharacterized protein BO96DRAFT_332173 [Aspergillus niger CBS 101883]XP_059603952.1 hypothetical protein An08g03140 [Aspergillus niger]PYH59085.1 hypothetical protein BO96DRAFT_332173 [Aspergillus niger CBS 101883]CAK45351.1 hypothetical protein An08g03140 [Aspergillus niger]
MAVGLACQSYMSMQQCSKPYQGVIKRFRVRNRLLGELVKKVFVCRSRQGNISQGMGDILPCSSDPAHYFCDKTRASRFSLPEQHFVSLRGWCIPEECIAELNKASSAWVYGLANIIGQYTLSISLNDGVGANTLMNRVPPSSFPDTNPFVLRGCRRVLLSPNQYKHSISNQENKVMSMQYDGVTSGCFTGILTLRFFDSLYAQ